MESVSAKAVTHFPKIPFGSCEIIHYIHFYVPHSTNFPLC